MIIYIAFNCFIQFWSPLVVDQLTALLMVLNAQTENVYALQDVVKSTVNVLQVSKPRQVCLYLIIS